MSYLNALRVHFAGQFQANVSTVNNDPGHFDNAAFQPSYQQMQTNTMPNGWFNPQGDASFRLLGCRVTSAWTPAGPVTAADPVLGYGVADADSAVPAKLVDLDSEQQLVSEIWGLQMRITDAAGSTLVSGDYLPAAFIDIWDRATQAGPDAGDITAGATYQSVLENLQWGDVSGSAFLTALQQAAEATGRLSVKFNVDGLNMDFTSPDFMCGRVVGTIGPYLAGEPLHLVLGRQFMAAAGSGGNFFAPAGQLNFFPAVVDATDSLVYLDLGNALPTGPPGGPPSDLGDLTLGAYDPIMTPPDPAGTVVPLGTIPSSGAGGYATDDWYAATAGVVALPLTADQLELAQRSQLVLTGDEGVAVSEWSNGAFVRADTFVYRMSPGDEVAVDVYATQFGQPYAGVPISFALDPTQLQVPPDGPPFVMPSPPVGTPADALAFPATATTDANGKVTLPLAASDPGTPRLFADGAYGIDGQVYGIRPAFADASVQDGPVNMWNFVSVLLWSGYAIPETPTWADVQPIFQQYANLYPVMLRFLNMADLDSIKANADLLTLAFGLDVTDPNSMPVTRDLSPAKRQTILTWLANPLPGPATAPEAAPRAAAPPGRSEEGGGAPLAARGGKAAAAGNRLVLQSR